MIIKKRHFWNFVCRKREISQALVYFGWAYTLASVLLNHSYEPVATRGATKVKKRSVTELKSKKDIDALHSHNQTARDILDAIKDSEQKAQSKTLTLDKNKASFKKSKAKN